jgi:hypothetical protein
VVDAVIPPEGRDRSIVVGSRVGLDSTNDCDSSLDWAQCDVALCHLGCRVILLIFLLHFEGDVEAVRVFQGGIVVFN